MEPLSPALLQRAFRVNKKNAAGADAWLPAELSHMPLVAATRLAEVLEAAEVGKGWPTALCAVLSAFVAKTAHHS
eukprot:14409599-Alexandrium_andersonii.AAC.1